jgi:hypothetical protein
MLVTVLGVGYEFLGFHTHARRAWSEVFMPIEFILRDG